MAENGSVRYVDICKKCLANGREGKLIIQTEGVLANQVVCSDDRCPASGLHATDAGKAVGGATAIVGVLLALIGISS